jgi:hypothetical protein
VVHTFIGKMIRIVTDKAIFLVLFLKIGCQFSLCGVLLLVLLFLLVGFIRGIFLYHIYRMGFMTLPSAPLLEQLTEVR